MPVQWQKRKKLGSEESENPPLQIKFIDDEQVPRNRKVSIKEHLANVVEKGAIELTKANLWLKKVKNQPSDEQTLRHRLEEEPEKFRHLVSFIFRQEYLQEFLSILQALGFKQLGGMEYLGWREADYSIAKDIDATNRLHMRLYVLKGVVFVMSHHEAKAEKDIKFHVKGYFERINKEVKTHQQTTKDNSDEDKANDDQTEDERIELANYEKGADVLLDILEKNVPNFYKKIDRKITEETLQIWRDYMGEIDHIPPEDRLIEDLESNALYIPPFQLIRDTVHKIFHRFNFECIPAWDLKVPSNDKYFIAKNGTGEKMLQILVITEDFIDDLMRVIGLLRTKYNVDFVLVISPDIALFGPGPDDIPPEGVEILPFNMNHVQELVNFLSDLDVSIISVSLFIDLFKLHLKNPLRLSHFHILFRYKGILDPGILQEIISEDEAYNKYFGEIQRLLQLLRIQEKGKWISLKNLKKTARKERIHLTDLDIENAIIFLENPFLGLLESKNNKHDDYHIKQDLSEFDFQAKIEKVNKLLREFLIEVESDKKS